MKLKLLNEYQQSPMSKAETSLLLSLLLTPPPDNKIEECIALAPTCQIIQSRLSGVQTATPLRVDLKVIMFLGLLCSSPGEAVLYAYTLKELACRNGGEFTLNDMTCKFPYGFPSRAEMAKAWDAQKTQGTPGGNYLDTVGAWKHG